MSTTVTQDERSARKQRQLLDASERVYYRHGDLGLTVRRLAAEADATSQTIYTYFGSRDAVIDGMYDRITVDLGKLLDAMETGLAGAGAGELAEVLADAGSTYRRYCVAHPARFTMLAGGHGPEGWDPAPMMELRDRLVAMVEQALGDVAGEAAPRLLLASWHGLIQAQLDALLPVPDTDDGGGSAADPSDVGGGRDQLVRDLTSRILSGA